MIARRSDDGYCRRFNRETADGIPVSRLALDPHRDADRLRERLFESEGDARRRHLHDFDAERSPHICTSEMKQPIADSRGPNVEDRGQFARRNSTQCS